MQTFILYHRAQKVAALIMDLNMSSGFISNIEVIREDLLPFPVKYSSKWMRADVMEDWINRRLMSTQRPSLEVLQSATGKDRLHLSFASYGLSLSDSYWFCPETESLNWEDINFFDHEFPYDVGNVIFGISSKSPRLYSPDLTTNGQLDKTWRRRDGEIWLLKKGSPPYYEEPFNEKIASLLLKKISKVPFVSYDVNFVYKQPVSICKSFTNQNTEFISAADLVRTAERPFFSTVQEHLRERCRYFKIPGYKEFLDQIRILDYITGNQDRHLGNYGFLYDTVEQKFVGPAPIFDNGSALWCQEATVGLMAEATKAYDQAMLRQIRHPEKLRLPQIDRKELQEMIDSVYDRSALSKDRVDQIGNLFCERYKEAVFVMERLELDRSRQKETCSEEVELG